jgi:hypothetical protein
MDFSQSPLSIYLTVPRPHLRFPNCWLFPGWGSSAPRPTPNLEDQVSIFISLGDWVAQLYPQALSTHFSRLLWHAWATVGLFFSLVTTRGDLILTAVCIKTSWANLILVCISPSTIPASYIAKIKYYQTSQTWITLQKLVPHIKYRINIKVMQKTHLKNTCTPKWEYIFPLLFKLIIIFCSLIN